MLIEDDQTMLSLLGTLLEMEGYEVIKTNEFEGILDEVKNMQPDAVLMDVHLENINGLDVLADLRGEASLNSVKIIMTSGIDSSYKSIELGANDFLLKPYMPDELIDKLENLFASEGR